MIDKELSGVIAIALLIVAFLVILIDVAIFIAWAFRKEAVDSGQAEPLFARTWSLVDVWFIGQAAIAITLIVTFTVMIGALLITGTIPFASSKSSSGATLVVLGVGLVVQNLMLGGLPLLNISKRYGVKLRDIGIRLLPTRRDLIIGIAAGTVLLVGSMLFEYGLAGLLNLAIGPAQTAKLTKLTENLTVDSMLKGGMSPAMFAVMFLGAGFLAPIGEEIFFRGFLYNSAKRRFGVAWGVAISAAVFALVHMGPIAVFVILFMGTGLAVMYEWSGSLWITITMHAFINSTQIAAAYLWPQLTK